MNRLKKHESPRTGQQRNTKGKLASARLKQIKKRDRVVSKKLRGN